MKISINAFSLKSINHAIKQLESFQSKLDAKTEELCRRLAEMGAVNVSLDYARAIYTGSKDISVSVESRGGGSYAIIASGETVLVVEFGAGVTMGDGHPQAAQFGMGVGTYPGQRHAFDPNGWYLPKSAGAYAGQHTYGNPPSMTMYNTEKDLQREIERVAREVFRS